MMETEKRGMEDAVRKVTGPCVILAGAGTGKTYTIIEKIKYLVSSGIYRPERIVCITFSNEAANNLTIRIERALAELGKSGGPIIRTFHGFSADLLRKHGNKVGISPDFKILEPDQAKVVLHRNLKVSAGNCHKYIGTIGTAKDLGINIEDFRSHLDRELKKLEVGDLEKRLEGLQFELQVLYMREEHKKKKLLVSEINKLRGVIELKKFVSAWNAYEKLKQKGNYQDYSDLNKNALELIEKYPEIARDFEYIIVDEFQDTNKVQLDFVVNLAAAGNITVVGDMNQSIYRFRGAYKENLSLFRKAFSVGPGGVFNLFKSYRSPNRVLKLAHELISHNYSNKDECFYVENVHGREGGKIEIYELRDAREEARKVVEIIERETGAGVPEEEICVMFRTHQQSRVIKRALEQKGIAYSSVSKASLLRQKSVRIAYDYLVILNKLKRKEKGGDQEWWDLVYRLDFLEEDLIKIGKCIKDFNRSAEAQKIENGNVIVSVYLFNNLEKLGLSNTGKITAKILIEKIKAMLGFLGKPISELLKEIYLISGLINEQRTREEKEIMLNLNKFYELAKMHEGLYDSDLSNFIYYLEVLESLGIEIEASQLEDRGVRLMTSHATKGLEYGVVIVTNMAQGKFPIERYSGNSLIPTELLPEIKSELAGLSEEEREGFVLNYEKHHQLLEERRLAYVSFTRAKEKLILTFADEYGGKKVSPSVFLKEFDYKNNPDVLVEVDLERRGSEPEMSVKSASDISPAGPEEVLNAMTKEAAKKEHKKMSPSALLLFDECQKQFEYKYVYNMPEKKSVSWELMLLGSFVHFILERGVNSGFKTLEEFLALAKETVLDEDWASVELKEAECLIRVFFERNKGKYNARSRTEQYLPLVLGGMDFVGFADRIDFTSNGVEIVDYKTGKTAVALKDRNWQMGFYALAAQERYGKVRKVVLDMLKQEKPLEFELDDEGNATCISSERMSGFNIYEVEAELLKTAQKIQDAYKTGFKPCTVEKNCEFCNEYVYGL